MVSLFAIKWFESGKNPKGSLPWGAFSLTVPDNVAVARSDKWMSQRQSGSYNEEFLKC